MKRLDKYIRLEQFGDKTKKTKKWLVLSKEVCCGEIKWYGGWRKYVYFHNKGHSDWDFLRYIADFCEQETLKQLNKI